LFRRAKSDNTRAKATISVSTLIATKNAMSFWDSVATGAQNAAETTKLVSIVRSSFSSSSSLFPREQISDTNLLRKR
jgi:GTPase Era involved in 16S rRNA processing